MTTQATSLLGLALPVTGELSGTWGDTVNTAITELLDSAVAGTTTLSADADVTLTTTTLAANQARQAILLWTASNGATTRNVTAPSQSKAYAVINAGTGSIVLRGATGPTAGITIVSGEKCLAAWNGSDFVKVASSVLPASALTGTVAIANGGTGQTTATAAFDALAPTTTQGDTIYYNGTDNVRLAKGTAGQALVMNSGATAPEWGTAGISTGKSIAMAMIFGF